MATAKTNARTFPIEPGLREALRTAVDRERRAIANMVEVMIRDYCQYNGSMIHEQQALFTEENRKPQPPER